MDEQHMRKINFFFADPAIEPNTRPGSSVSLSVLYLLRRDIRGCLGASTYLIPATMTILAGIDLLGKFYAGNDDRGGVRTRFRDFVSAYFAPLAHDDDDVIYALRNALLHSFGLYCEGRNFILAERLPHADLVIPQPDNTFVIGVHTLYERFEQAIARYYQELITSERLQQNFDRMFDHYGFINIFVPVTPPLDACDS